MLAEVSHFEDAQQHAASLPFWDQVYDQITAGRFHSTLTRLRSGSLEIVREFINQRVVQYGHSPAERLHFALPVTPPTATSLQGCPVDGNTLMVLRGNADFVFHVPPQFETLQVSIDNADILAMSPELHQRLHARRGGPLIRVDAARMARVRDTLLSALDGAVCHPEQMAFAASQKLLHHQVTCLLLELIEDEAGDIRHDLTHATHSDIVRRSQAIVQASPDEPVTVLDLCQQLRVSRRTLQNSFQLIANTTPVDYLRSIRLNGVRRLLQQGGASSVREVAGQWGFFHLGHFSRDYRRLFDELPSETRARAL